MSASTTSTPALDLHLVTQAPASCSRVLNCYSLRGDPCTRRDEGLLYISNRQRDGKRKRDYSQFREPRGRIMRGTG